MNIMPELKRSYNKEEDYYYSHYEDVIEYNKKMKVYQEKEELRKKEEFKKQIKNDPEGDFWYNIKTGTNILVSYDNKNWEKAQFYDRGLYHGKYVVTTYRKNEFNYKEGFRTHYCSSHQGSGDSFGRYEYAKIDNEESFYDGARQYEKYLKIQKFIDTL